MKIQSLSPPCSILVIVRSGSGYVDVHNERHSLVSGSVLAFPGTSVFSLLPQPGLHGVWVEYTCLLQDSPDISPLNGALPPLRQCSPQVTALADELYNAWLHPQGDKPFAVQALFADLLVKVYSTPVAKSTEDETSSWLHSVLLYIDTHYSEDLTRSQMSGLAGVSPEHFSRSFRKATGQTFNAYLSLLRIRKAQQRLLTGTPNLTDLALEVGYGEGTYLSRKFKQIVGVSPTVYHSKSKRIVTLNYNHTASLRALEIIPQLGPYSAWLESVDTVPAARKLSLEARRASSIYNSVAAVQPDVIISYTLSEESRHLLPLAPIIELPFMHMSWREQFRLIAVVVNQGQRAEEWLLHYDELCQEANLQLNRAFRGRGSAIVWEIGSRSAYCFSGSFGRGCQVLYNDLGFQLPDAMVKRGIGSKGYLETTIEDIPSYPADHIIITGLPSQPESQHQLNRLFHSEQWLQLDAVRNEQVYILDEPDMFYGFDPLSSQAQLQVLLRALTS
jgi:ABC-type Fe3+-hydroxamate transport system substrate-binding protein